MGRRGPTWIWEVLAGRMLKLESLSRSRWKAWLGSMCRNSPSSLNPTLERKVKTPRISLFQAVHSGYRLR